MTRGRWRSRLAIWLLTALSLLGLVAVAVSEWRERRLDIAQMEAYSQEDLSWVVSQTRFETARFVMALQSVALAGPHDTAPASLVERYDILWSRAALFHGGVVAARLRRLDDGGLIARLDDALIAIEPGMTGEAPFQPLAYAERFSALLTDLQLYNTRVSEFEEAWMLSLQASLLDATRISDALKAVSALSVVALLAVVLVHARIDRRRLREQRLLTAGAQVAAETRQRFLTMMSHELRTPMNGVLGMLGLLEHRLAQPEDRGMVQIARRSGLEMAGLLEDILELSAQEAGAQPPRRDVLRMGDLVDDLKRRVAGRCGPEALVVTAAPDAQTVLSVDAESLMAAVRHTVAVIVARLGAESCALALVLRHDRLVATVTADAPGVGWDPRSLFGTLTARGDAIGTEAIGATLARAHIQRMGGEGHADLDAEGRVVMRIVAPAVRLSVPAASLVGRRAAPAVAQGTAGSVA